MTVGSALHRIVLVAAAAIVLAGCAVGQQELRGTGDLGVIVERERGSLKIVDSTHFEILHRVEGLGDLSHATVKFSRDARYAYVFGRDGGLTKVDILRGAIVARTVEAGNSVGGAISQDGRLIAVSNYEPGGVQVFDAETLELIVDIPARVREGAGRSKVVGLVDAPGQKFVFSLYEAGETWVADFDVDDLSSPEIRRYPEIGRQPYDGLITPDGRYHIAGLYGEDGLALLDLWDLDGGVRRILDGYGRGEEPLPVYKMPHLEGWAQADGKLFLPAVGRHELLVVDPHQDWREVGRIPVYGQPIFAVARPDGRQVWVNFAFPDNNVIQVVDVVEMSVVAEMEPGPGVLHMEFSPRGEHLWLSVRDENRVEVYDTATLERIAELQVETPSGIFLTYRAHRIGL